MSDDATTDLARHEPVLLRPDPARTVMRPFEPGDPDGFVGPVSRAERIVERVLTLGPDEVAAELKRVTRSLDARHREVDDVLRRRFQALEGLTADRGAFTDAQALLVGAYFTEEFSFESAALFNPSAVAHPDQSGLPAGATRFVLSLRGIGEGHVSSLTFRTGVWAADGSVAVDPPSPQAVGPIVERTQDAQGDTVMKVGCGGAREISEAVIFPFLPSQGRGIEDVRLVRFTDDDGSTNYRGTFTAFSGSDVLQGLLETQDFVSFEMRSLKGPLARSKGLALFPRRIGGRWFALSREDNENIWLTSTDDPHVWERGVRLLAPRYPWEFIQLGNCGSPIELDEGWLVLTHGVGTVRNYCVGAALLDKDDPSKVLARLPRPLLEPSDKERDGYVPNVVYSCGGLLRDRTLLLPYGVADNFTAFATVEIDPLLAAMR